MLWSDMVARVVKATLALVTAIVMDYAFLQGRMTRQAVTGIERALADAPNLINRLVAGVQGIKLDR